MKFPNVAPLQIVTKEVYLEDEQQRIPRVQLVAGESYLGRLMLVPAYKQADPELYAADFLFRVDDPAPPKQKRPIIEYPLTIGSSMTTMDVDIQMSLLDELERDVEKVADATMTLDGTLTSSKVLRFLPIIRSHYEIGYLLEVPSGANEAIADRSEQTVHQV